MTERFVGSEAARPRIEAIKYKPSKTAWCKIERDVLRLAEYAQEQEIIKTPNIEGWCMNIFLHPLNTHTTVLLAEGEKTIGFSTATRTSDLLGLRPAKEVAEIHTTVIDPPYQGQRHIGTLMETMEDALKAQGYKQIQSLMRADNGYAAATVRHYGERVTYTSQEGEQYQFVVIEL